MKGHGKLVVSKGLSIFFYILNQDQLLKRELWNDTRKQKDNLINSNKYNKIND